MLYYRVVFCCLCVGGLSWSEVVNDWNSIIVIGVNGFIGVVIVSVLDVMGF